MLEEERFYYQRRAETETERAQKATVPKVVQVHYQLAEAYFEKIDAIKRAILQVS